MSIDTLVLIKELNRLTTSFIAKAKVWKELPLENLNARQSSESWSVLECLEHLNLYGDFYIPEIKKQIANTPYKNTATHFNSGKLGNYFANSMQPQPKMKKMATFADKNPKGSQLNKNTIERFIQQQEEMLVLLKAGKGVNLTKTKTKCTLPIIKFRLGDTFRFVIYHNHRHIVQAEGVLERV